MITEAELDKFLRWPANPGRRVLSVYLQRESSSEKSFHRKFEVEFQTMSAVLEKELPKERREEYRRDVEHARNFLSSYEPQGRTLVLFTDASEGILWAKELNVEIASQIQWLEKPFALPLLE